MIKNIFGSTLVLALALLLSSCYGRDDNYKYKEPRPAITISGVEASYGKTSFVDQLHIEPQITTTLDNPDLEYLWTIYTSYISPPEVVPVRTIGTEPVLDFPVNEKPQTYIIELKVTDKNNGLEAFASTRLEVSNEFSLGHYILKEIDGGTDMDLHLPDNDVIPDLLNKSLGARITGTPNHLGLLGKYSFLNEETAQIEVTTALNVATDTEFNMVNVADMGVIHTHDDMFYYDDPQQEESLFSTFNFYGATYVSDKGVYFTSYDLIWGSGGSGKFGTAMAIPGGCRPSRHIMAEQYYVFMFDELNKRFMYSDFNGTLYAYNNEDSQGNIPPYTPNNVPYDLIYFGRNQIGSNDPSGFAVMQDPNNPDKRYLYEMSLAGGQENPIISVSEITGLNFNRAERFAMNELQARVIYYFVGNQLYSYKIDDGVEEPITLNGFDAGDEITYLSNRYWQGGSDDNFNYLAIGTYSGGNYKVYLYNVVGGTPVGAPARILQGQGKMRFMQYVTPLFTPQNGDKYPLS